MFTQKNILIKLNRNTFFSVNLYGLKLLHKLFILKFTAMSKIHETKKNVKKAPKKSAKEKKAEKREKKAKKDEFYSVKKVFEEKEK